MAKVAASGAACASRNLICNRVNVESSKVMKYRQNNSTGNGSSAFAKPTWTKRHLNSSSVPQWRKEVQGENIYLWTEKKNYIKRQSCWLVAKFLTWQNKCYSSSAHTSGLVYKIKQKKTHRPLWNRCFMQQVLLGFGQFLALFWGVKCWPYQVIVTKTYVEIIKLELNYVSVWWQIS